MILMDENVLVYAHREDTADHQSYRDWVEETINGGGGMHFKQEGYRFG